MCADHRVPRHGSTFVGRADELAAISAAVVPGRVLTLVGPGGTGKTRLAARVATGQGRDAWWVDLSEARTHPEVVAAVATAVEVVTAAGDPLATLAHGLAGRSLLLVLDNCEQAAPAVAALLAVVVPAAPGVAVLATSRSPLGAATERVRRVPPLTLDEAVTLFLDRAEAAGTVPGPGARSGARRVCDRLDRLPLALELAAGWSGMLSLDQIAEGLREPLDLLTDGPRSAPFRLRTLEGSIRWSHDLLGADERLVFRRLGAFRPGCTLDQVGMVCADLPVARVRTAVRRLVDHSLLVADASGAVARYTQLGVIHAFAVARLDEAGETAAAHDRHLAALLATVESATPLLDTDRDAWRAAMHPEYANIVAAIEWGSTRPDSTPARRLAARMGWLWHLEQRGDDGLRLLTAAAGAGAGERSAVQARTLAALALVGDVALPGGQGYRWATEALDIAEATGDAGTARLARSLLAVAAVAVDLDQARELARRARADGLAAGDAFTADGNAVLLGILHQLRDEYAEAETLLAPAAGALAARGDRGLASTALAHLALVAARTGRRADAAALAGQAVTTATPLADVHRLGLAVAVRAEVLGMQGRLDEAIAGLAPIGRAIDAAHGAAFVPGWERTMARLALWQGRPLDAVAWCRREVRWLGDAAADDQLAPETQAVLVTALRVGGDPDGARVALAVADRSAHTFGQPRLLGDVAEEAGHLATDPHTAHDAHHRALASRAELGLVPGCVDSLEAIAALGPARGAVGHAVVLLAAASALRETIGYAVRTAPLPVEITHLAGQPDHADAVATGRALGLGAVELALRMRGRRGRPDTGWGSLTPTERSVVDLAVQGLSNPQIAQRLFVSRGTVKTHLAHVYAKLGVANRTELAAASMQR